MISNTKILIQISLPLPLVTRRRVCESTLSRPDEGSPSSQPSWAQSAAAVHFTLSLMGDRQSRASVFESRVAALGKLYRGAPPPHSAVLLLLCSVHCSVHSIGGQSENRLRFQNKRK